MYSILKRRQCVFLMQSGIGFTSILDALHGYFAYQHRYSSRTAYKLCIDTFWKAAIILLPETTYYRSHEKNRLELFISKTTITSVWAWDRWITQMQHKRMVMCTQIHTNKYIEHLKQQQKAWRKAMYENANIQTIAVVYCYCCCFNCSIYLLVWICVYIAIAIQTVAVDFSRRREQEPSILRMFVRINVLD